MEIFILEGSFRQPLSKGEDFSLAWEIKAVQQLEQGAFTTAVGPQDSDFFPGANLEHARFDGVKSTVVSEGDIID